MLVRPILHGGKKLSKLAYLLMTMCLNIPWQYVCFWDSSAINTHLPIDWLNLLECGKHKYGGFSHTRLCLAQDVHAQDGLWNALMLD